MVRKKERSLRSDCQSVPSLRLQEFPNESLRSSPDAAANNELGFACQKNRKVYDRKYFDLNEQTGKMKCCVVDDALTG